MIHTETRTINRTLYGLRQKTPLILQQGGTSSGKTWGNEYALLSYMLYDRKDDVLLASIVSETLPHLKKGAIKDFKDILNLTGLDSIISHNKTDHQFTLPNGGVIEFFSADNETKVRGPRRDILFINEANSISWEVYYQLNLRTKETVILDWNPSGLFWLHDKLLPSMRESEYLFTRTTYKDNPAISEKVANEIERLKDIDPYLYRVYAEGKTGQIKGLIFKRVRHTSTFPSGCKKLALALDFGYSNDPTALILAGVKNGEVFTQELIYEKGLTNDDIHERLKGLNISKSIQIFADAAEPKSIEELKRKGWNITSAAKGKDSLAFGIDLLKNYNINICGYSPNFKKEAEHYKWKEKDGNLLNVPIDAYNHCWDALRYYAVTMLTNKKPSSGYSFWKAGQ